MKSPKPNDPRRLRILGFGKTKTRHGETITVPVTIEYDTWCCTEAHEYAYATKCITDLFENTQNLKERTLDFAAQLEFIVDELIANKPVTPDQQNTITNRIYDIAQRLRLTYGDIDDN